MAHTILVVDDEATVRDTVALRLEQDGHRVVTAADGREALQLFRAEKPDLILLDLIMPKLNGFDVLQALKKDAPTAHIPVIIMSNLGQDRDVQQAMDAGAAAYFVKTDLSLQALVQRVEETLTAGGV